MTWKRGICLPQGSFGSFFFFRNNPSSSSSFPVFTFCGPGTPSYTHALTLDYIQIPGGTWSGEPDKVKRIYLIDVDGGLESHSGVLGKRSRER